MAFADLAKSHAAYVASHVLGESVQYQAHPGATWATLKAKVQRRPVDPIGQVLSNSVEVFVSKSAVAKVSVGKDQVRLTADAKVGEPVPRYRVTEILGEGPGHWWLRCVK